MGQRAADLAERLLENFTVSETQASRNFTIRDSLGSYDVTLTLKVKKVT